MEQTKTHWKKLVNPDYIGAYSLEEGKDLVVKILSVARQMVKGTGGREEECTVATLENQKPFILNRTNCATIQKIYNTPYIEQWSGKEIILYATTTKLKKDTVECLRIRQKQVIKAKSKLNDSSFDKAIKAIESGSFTKDKLLSDYELSKDQIKTATAL